ncbi:chloride channel protein [Vagococcus fluvialis]
MGTSNWELRDLLLFMPLVLIGLLAGKAYLLLKKQMKKIFNFWQNSPIKKALIGSLAISLIGIFLPSLLFSGQTSLGQVPDKYLHYSMFFLLVVVLLKLVFLEVCLQTGWVGGDIFPIVFASILFGFTLSQAFSSFDILFVTSVLASSMAITIIDSPIGVALFIALFFPVNIFPIILLVALCFFIKKRLINK